MDFFWVNIWAIAPVWILFGITAAVIANARGADGFSGFLLGLVLGPLGLIITFFMGSQEKRDQRDIETGLKKVCPRCAETVMRAALVCKHCGAEFDPTTIPTPAGTQQPDYSSDHERQQGIDRWFWGCVLAAIMAVFAVAAIALSKSDKPQSASDEQVTEANEDVLAANLAAAAAALDAAAGNVDTPKKAERATR